MSVSETTYAFEVQLPQWIERGRAQTVKMVARSLNGAIAPVTQSGSTYSLFDGSSTALIDAQAVTVNRGVPEYEISAATIPETLALSQDWREQWVLAMPDGISRTVRRTAGLCLRLLYPCISFADLEKRHRTLSTYLPDTDPYAESYIQDAWVSIENKLLGQGRRPNLIMSVEALRDPHIALSLHRIFQDAATSLGDGRYNELGAEYLDQYDKLWSELSFVYDNDESGAEDADTRESGTATVWTNRPPRWY